MSQGGSFLIKLRGNCGFKVEAVQKLTTKGVAGAPVVPVEKGKYKNKVLKVSQVKVNQEQAADFIAVTANGIRVRVVKFQFVKPDGKIVTISLATSIPADKLDLFQISISALYRSRWQCEIFY